MACRPGCWPSWPTRVFRHRVYRGPDHLVPDLPLPAVAAAGRRLGGGRAHRLRAGDPARPRRQWRPAGGDGMARTCEPSPAATATISSGRFQKSSRSSAATCWDRRQPGRPAGREFGSPWPRCATTWTRWLPRLSYRHPMWPIRRSSARTAQRCSRCPASSLTGRCPSWRRPSSPLRPGSYSAQASSWWSGWSITRPHVRPGGNESCVG